MPRPRVAVINTHPIQHFAPVWRDVTKRNEVDLKVFFCTEWGMKEYNDPGFGLKFKWDVNLLDGYEYEFLQNPNQQKKLGFWDVNNPSVTEALARFKPDVLIVWGYAHLTTWRAVAWARTHGVRVLVHSDAELLHARPLRTRALKAPAVRFFFSQVDGALPVGDRNAEYYQHYGLEAASHHWWAFAIDGPRFQKVFDDRAQVRKEVRAELGIEPTDLVFVAVGKFIERKRMKDLVEAFGKLSPDDQRRSRVMIIGDGELKPEVVAQAAPLGDRAILTGFKNQSQIPRFIAAADILVVSSSKDAHPLVVAEAGYLGLPCIASDKIGCVGPHDSVRVGENGWLYPCADTKALAEVMSTCLAMTPEELKKFENRAREVSLLQDSGHVARLFCNAIARATSRPRPSPRTRLKRLLTVDHAPSTLGMMEDTN